MIEITNIDLPNNWIIAKLSDMVIGPKSDFVDGPFGSNLKSSEYRDVGVPVFRIQNIKAGYFLDKNIQFITSQKAEQIKRHSFKLGDIIITKLGEPLGLCCKVPVKYPSGIIVADLMRVRPSAIIVNTDYLVYAINSKIIQNQFKTITKGTTRARVNLTIVRDIEIPLAPINEQNRIVLKLEELLSELEKGKEQLQTSLEQLKVYRQSILKHAFEGKLTESNRKKKQFCDTKELINQLREQGKELKIKLKYPKIKDDEVLPLIPKEWQWIRNEELLKYVTSGSRDWKQYYSHSGSIFIRTQDIKTNNLNLENAAYVKLPTKAEGKRSLVKLNDILMTITGANVGKVALIDKEIPEAYVSQSVALMKYLDSRITKYMWYFFQSRSFGQGLISNLVYGVGRPVLSLENMKEVPVALCSIEEQEAIVNEIENRFSVCDKMEAEIFQSLNQIEPLKQGLLQKAFEGRLVEPDPKDEPASILLERIKKEREESIKEKKGEKINQKKQMKKNTAKIFELPLLDTIKDKFGKKSFSFDQLKPEVDINYDDLREELFSLLDNEKVLVLEFDQKKQSMNFKYIGK
jgi:type I restriction enzyme, S subunit